jgi:DNA (cytosine-5)-methyltransferase 1
MPVPRAESNTLTGVGIDNLIVQPCLTPDREEKRQNGRRFKEDGEPMFTLTGQDVHGIMITGNIYPSGHEAGNVYDPDGISPTIKCNGPRPNKNNVCPKVEVRTKWLEREVQGKEECSTLRANSHGNNPIVAHNPGEPTILTATSSGRGEGLDRYRECRLKTGEANTLQAGGNGQSTQNFVILPDNANALDCDGYLRAGARPRDENGETLLLPIGYRRIRRLMPVECEALMGFPRGWTAQGLTKDGRVVPISDTQRYKMAGNSVIVPVIETLGRLLMRSLLEANNMVSQL